MTAGVTTAGRRQRAGYMQVSAIDKPGSAFQNAGRREENQKALREPSDPVRRHERQPTP
jgi:hypothetical protein